MPATASRRPSYADRRRAFAVEVSADSPEFRLWVGAETPLTTEREDEIRARFGVAPKFLPEAIGRWGSLTPNQLAFARRAFAEAESRQASRAAERAAVAAVAAPWVAGRQRIEGVILARKTTEWGQIKLLVRLDDGRKVWGSTGGISTDKGDRIAFTATVEPSADDVTFAFYKRPTAWEVLVPAPVVTDAEKVAALDAALAPVAPVSAPVEVAAIAVAFSRREVPGTRTFGAECEVWTETWTVAPGTTDAEIDALLTTERAPRTGLRRIGRTKNGHALIECSLR